MSSTTIDVTLSPNLVTELSGAGNGVYAEAVYFDSSGNNPTWTDFVNNGTVQNGGSAAIVFQDATQGAKLYLLVQSTSAGAANVISNVISSESDITWGNAASDDYAYDSFEFTLQNSSADQGNLTSVNAYGLPLGVVVPSNGSRGYSISGTSLTNDLGSLVINNGTTNTTINADATYTTGALAGDFREAIAPATAVTTSGTVASFSPSDWTGYIDSLEGTLANDITIAGFFNGAKDAEGTYHNAGYYAYDLSWDGTDFLLAPLSSSQIQGTIEISPTQLADSIYSTLGTVDVTNNGTTAVAGMNAGANNQWGAVLRDFVTGFDAGYLGASGAQINPQLSGTVDLNKEFDWSPIYAFGSNAAAGTPAQVYYDQYNKVITDNSNSYGWTYSDQLESQYSVGPLISLYDSATSTNVGTIDLTVYAPGDTPTGGGTSQGYTPPQLYNYIAPSGGTYAAADALNTSNADQIKLYASTNSGTTAGVTLPQTGTVTLKILVGDIANTPTWDSVTLGGGAQSLFQQWEISGNSSSGYTAAPVSGTSQPAGTVLIGGVSGQSGGIPVATNGVSWYQIVVGTKTYNLYTTTTGGTFVTTAGSLAVDGGASIQPQTNGFEVDLSSSLDPSSLVRNTDPATVSTLQVPDAPVAGTVGTGGTFAALAGQTNLVTNTITTAQNDLAFAWTGENNAPGSGTASWISGYTNKIAALDVARITLTPTAGGSAITTTATANIDGDWQTGTVDVPNGTYNVTMQEFLPTDTLFATPLTPVSSALTLTVNATPGSQGVPVAWADTTTGASGVDQASPYSGPDSNLAYSYARITNHNINITTSVKNIWIATGPGNDAIAVNGGGTNVLDGGTGSNFFWGGTGADGGFDTFRTVFTPDQASWNNVVNFHKNDVLVIWNATSFSENDWIGIDGTTQYHGATLQIGDDRVTLSGISMKQAENLSVQVSNGSNGQVPFVALFYTA
jgi:hypothetical protein